MPGYGMQGFFGIARQNSYGTAVTASAEYYPFLTEGLATTIEQLGEEGVRERYGENPVHQGLEQNQGDMGMEVHPIGIGHFLKGVCNVCTSTYKADSCYTHDFIPNNSDFDTISALQPYTFLFHRGISKTWQFTDGVISRLEMNVVNGQLVKATAGLLAITASLMTKPSPTFTLPAPWVWNTASFTVATTPDANISEANISIDNQLEGVTTLNATKRWGRLTRTGYQMVRVAGTMIFQTQSSYEDFYAGTERRLLLNLSSSVTSYNTMLIDVPKFRYETFPVNVGGPGLITVGFTGRGIYNETSNYAIKVSLVNTRASY